jgi:hypothetical protein
LLKWRLIGKCSKFADAAADFVGWYGVEERAQLLLQYLVPAWSLAKDLQLQKQIFSWFYRRAQIFNAHVLARFITL